MTKAQKQAASVQHYLNGLPISSDAIPLRASWQAQLMHDITTFCTAKEMNLGTFGAHAIGNFRLMERMAEDRSCNLLTADKIYAYMAKQGFHFSS